MKELIDIMCQLTLFAFLFVRGHFLLKFLITYSINNIFLHIYLNHYDNYSHWATIVKFLYTEGRLPDVYDTIIAYTYYPMGSSLLVYFAAYLVGYTDSVLIIGQFALILSCLYGMFSVVRDSSRALILAMLFNIIATFNHFNKVIRMNNIPGDFLLTLLSLARIASIYKMRQNLKAMSIYTLLVVSALTLVKSSAIFLQQLSWFIIYTKVSDSF